MLLQMKIVVMLYFGKTIAIVPVGVAISRLLLGSEPSSLLERTVLEGSGSQD